jgi:hypothetical protein
MNQLIGSGDLEIIEVSMAHFNSQEEVVQGGFIYRVKLASPSFSND